MDLFTCRRFILVAYNTNTFDENRYSDFTVILYFTEDNKWIEYHMEEYQDEEGTSYPESYQECAPETAAHQFLRYKAYGKNLPPELEKYRSVGDPDMYQEWVKGNPSPVPSRNAHLDSIPHWDKESQTVLYGGRLCKQFGKAAPQQEAILDAFESKGWLKCIDSPFRDKLTLKHTVDSMNKWPGSSIEFYQDKRRVRWRARRPRPSSADSR